MVFGTATYIRRRKKLSTLTGGFKMERLGGLVFLSALFRL